MWKPVARRREHLAAVIGKGCEIEGRCHLVGATIVDGHIVGELVAEELIVGEHGTIEATVHARQVVVRGTIRGDIIASGRVELTATARVTGDIEAGALAMADGALFDGRCRIVRTPHDAAREDVVVALAG